jgi:cytochrome c oxidase subunit 2
MKVDLYEKIWMWGVAALLALFFASTAFTAVTKQVAPPSHVETIDPATVLRDPRFARHGVAVDEQGNIHVTIVGLMFAWLPGEFTLPAGRPVTFHITSTDVQHGFEIVRTNGQSMVLPGYVSQFTTQFNEGEYLIACNEYCGTGHHTMAGKIHVVPADTWEAPAPGPVPFKTSEASHDGH